MVSPQIDYSQSIDKIQLEKTEKEKKIFDEIVTQLKDLLHSGAFSLSQIKSSINELMNISPELAQKDLQLLENMEKDITKQVGFVNDSVMRQHMKKMLENPDLSGVVALFNTTNDNATMASAITDYHCKQQELGSGGTISAQV